MSVCYDHDKTEDGLRRYHDDREDVGVAWGRGGGEVKRARSPCSRRYSPNTEAHAASGLGHPLPYHTVSEQRVALANLGD